MKINKLIKNVAKGHKPSLEKIYNLMSKKLYIISLNYLKNTEESKDIIQNTFIKIVEKSPTFKGLNGTAWITAICRNLCLDKLRHNNRFKMESIDIIFNLPSQNNFAKDIENKIYMENKLKLLSEDEFNVIIMFYYENLHIRQIAKYLDKKNNTVYKIHKRAIEKLNKSMKNEDIA